LIFVDTGAWFALQVTDDQWHGAAAAVFPKILAQHDTLVTSNHVVGETYTLLRSSKGFQEAWRFLEAMEQSRRVEVRIASAELEQEERWSGLPSRPARSFALEPSHVNHTVGIS
jgi:predicted nucleic acid-binding protein